MRRPPLDDLPVPDKNSKTEGGEQWTEAELEEFIHEVEQTAAQYM